MSNLFVRLYLDEDVNVLVADLLRARGFDAVTVRDVGQLRATDAEQLSLCYKPKKNFGNAQ